MHPRPRAGVREVWPGGGDAAAMSVAELDSAVVGCWAAWATAGGSTRARDGPPSPTAGLSTCCNGMGVTTAAAADEPRRAGSTNRAGATAGCPSVAYSAGGTSAMPRGAPTAAAVRVRAAVFSRCARCVRSATSCRDLGRTGASAGRGISLLLPDGLRS